MLSLDILKSKKTILDNFKGWDAASLNKLLDVVIPYRDAVQAREEEAARQAAERREVIADALNQFEELGIRREEIVEFLTGGKLGRDGKLTRTPRPRKVAEPEAEPEEPVEEALPEEPEAEEEIVEEAVEEEAPAPKPAPEKAPAKKPVRFQKPVSRNI